MRISQLLNERISITHIVPYIEKFLISMFQKETTKPAEHNEHVEPGAVALKLDMLGIQDIDRMLAEHDFQGTITHICKNVLNVDANIRVSHGKNNTFASTALITSRANGTLTYTLTVSYSPMDELVVAYRNEILGRLHRIDDAWVDLAEQYLTKAQSIELIQRKDDIIQNLFPTTDGFRNFCAIIVHELTHLMSDESAFASYRQKGIDINNKPMPHVIQQYHQKKKMQYSDKKGTGLHAHLASPNELDSYAQEISSKVQHIIRNNTLSTEEIKPQLVNLIKQFRKEIEFNADNLTSNQRKYINKLYKRVYQEVIDAISNDRR